MGAGQAALYVGSFIVQTIAVFAGNSRLFGILKEGSGWRTNVEMASLYTSFVTPAGWAFAIWGVIYLAEAVSVCVLAAAEVDIVPFDLGGDRSRILGLWVTMNVCQALWSVLFANEKLILSSVALGGIAASLIALGCEATPGSGWLGYLAVCAPVWLHAGWTTAAALVNVNLTLVGHAASAPVQLAAAFATVYAAVAAGLVTLGSVGAGALPHVAALSWALAAVRHKLLHPDALEVANNVAIGEVGQPARTALEMSAGVSSSLLIAVIFTVLVWVNAFEYGAIRRML